MLDKTLYYFIFTDCMRTDRMQINAGLLNDFHSHKMCLQSILNWVIMAGSLNLIDFILIQKKVNMNTVK